MKLHDFLQKVIFFSGKTQVQAANDGLSTEDFVNWFFGRNHDNIFEGVVIQFTDFRY